MVIEILLGLRGIALPVLLLLVASLRCGRAPVSKELHTPRTDPKTLLFGSTDSAQAVRIAKDSLRVQQYPFPMYVSSFLKHEEGFLIRVTPAGDSVLGGGGLVWVSRTGKVVILAEYQ